MIKSRAFLAFGWLISKQDAGCDDDEHWVFCLSADWDVRGKRGAGCPHGCCRTLMYIYVVLAAVDSRMRTRVGLGPGIMINESRASRFVLMQPGNSICMNCFERKADLVCRKGP